MRRPVQGRVPVGYHRDFLEGYVPNRTQYLPDKIRTHLRNIGTLKEPGQTPDGTYPPVLVNRLLIDLSWASSRLEGNTYSLLETRNLVEAGQGGRIYPAPVLPMARSSCRGTRVVSPQSMQFLFLNASGVMRPLSRSGCIHIRGNIFS